RGMPVVNLPQREALRSASFSRGRSAVMPGTLAQKAVALPKNPYDTVRQAVAWRWHAVSQV
ncbi:MAG: hypothetical protein MK186_13615, partial [Henriciella sp.]|nr:hypothetical protein [Henriciella sp.]